MMRFPALLLARIVKAQIARVLPSARTRTPGLIHWVDPGEILHAGSDAPVSRERMQKVVRSPTPLIWIGGSEPLDHAGIAHFVRAIAQSGHCVFLETNGILLRRRIHEFQPVPQLFLAVRLGALHLSESRLVIEGLLAARLSGFFTVVHSLIQENSEVAEWKTLRAFLAEKDLDGWLMTATSEDPTVIAKAAESRAQISSVFWRRFSERVEHELLMHAKGREAHAGSFARKPDAESYEESVRLA